ncbi:MAG TPA: 4Fe-4S binding protein [Bryobacteraceae bacterium]|nr:4Fe-4S binding protein [Bryobacteraceae bacterium]
MSEHFSRRDLLHTAVRGTVLATLGGGAGFLIRKAHGQVVWQVDAARCLNSRLGEVGVAACNLCTTECVVSLSAVRAVNEHSRCGRCNICPAYFNITSAVDDRGLPSEKLCPRDAIMRKPIGKADPEDPANNFYEYLIDEEKCDGCGKCVMQCKEPLGLGSIVLRIRYNRCVDCNRCAISTACPKDALIQVPVEQGLRNDGAH